MMRGEVSGEYAIWCQRNVTDAPFKLGSFVQMKQPAHLPRKKLSICDTKCRLIMFEM